MPERSSVPAVDRACNIVELIAANPRGLSLSQLAVALELPKSTAHGLVHSLRVRNYLSYDDTTKTYHLGLRLWELSRAFPFYEELVRLSLPIMRDIVRELNEITQLAVRDSIYNVYLAKVDCDHPIQLISQVGKRLYCHATALGKVLLAACTNEEIDEMYANISLPRFTPHTITDLSTLKKEIAQCRVQGYAEDHEEYVAGLRCVAVPLLSQSSEVLAAMSVSLPAPRATPERLTQALSALQVGARAFQCRLMQVDRWEK